MTDINLTLNTGGEKGEKGDRGERGEQGPRGLTGTGQRGIQGERGPQGYGLGVHGVVPGVGELPTTGSPGDGWIVLPENATQGHLYIWSGSSWTDAGPVTGPAGPQGLPGSQGPAGPQWINWRGLWMNNTSYEIGDGVYFISTSNNEGWTLRCRLAHTSGSEFNINNWNIILVAVPGPRGERGQIGERGDPGERGLTGSTGDNGLSAYQLAVLEGYTGTLTQWLASLRGAAGENGQQGQQGPAGVNAVTVVFTNEAEFNAYEPQFNEIAILNNA